MKKRCLQSVGLAVVLACSLAQPEAAAAQTRPAPAPAGQRAGSITALLPVAKITRGTGRNRAITEAKKGDPVVFNDLLQTEKGGRARITLTDQSILSLGSQAELRILKHDARTQQTQLQLGYGRVRAEVASVTRDGGRFELRTPTAVAGVIGTDFGTDSSIPGITNFICISGIVEVSNSDAKIPGMVPCPAGSTTSVSTGLPPTAPKPATQQQIQQLIQDTEPAIISGLSPASALLGSEVLAAASGSKMSGINAVSINGSGISVSLEGAATDTSANLKVVVYPNAAPGTRTITFTKANGQTAAAVFSVLAPPQKGADGSTDFEVLKKVYLEILEQERQSAITGVNALGIGVQQSAADAQQAIENENNKLQPPLDIAPIERELQGDVAPMLEAMTAAGASINEDTANASAQLETLFAEAQKRIADANPPPTDDAKLKLAKDIFDRVNAPLLSRFRNTQDRLGDMARRVNAGLLRTMARWVENFKVEAARQRAVPLPKVDADERTYDLGLPASFDAARSTASPGGSIANFQWVLCDPAYRPAQVGVPLPPNDTRCQPIAGFASNSSDFKFPTCELKPLDHIARVTVIDTNNRATAMDVRVRILPPSYDGPGLRLRGLSNAYEQLQLSSFLSFFDESYSGLTELQESIRRTFTSLASMNINLRLSQANLGCNEATVRADWEQAYTFKDDLTCAGVPAGTVCQRVVFKQQEQLTVRMKRVPGKNWYITEFQGDNGTVQGTPPGPIQRDQSLPDLRIASLTPVAIPTGPAAGHADSTIGVAPGANGFAAVVENIGDADLQTGVRVRFVARDGSGNTIATDVRDLPGPIPVGSSATVIGQLDVPDLGPGVGARIFAIVNPGCVVTEKNCDGGNATLLDVIIGVIDLQVTGLNQLSPIIATQPGQVDITIKNLGSRVSQATASNLRMIFGTTPTGSGGIPAIAPGATATVPLQFVAPNLSGTQPVTIAIAPPTPGEFNPANDNLAGSLNLTAAVVDLKASGLAFSGAAPPFLSGQTVNITLNVQNNGNRPSVATNVLACQLVSPAAGTHNFAPVPLAPIAAGAAASGLTYSFVVPPNFSGNDTLTCGVSQDTFEPPTFIADNQVSLAMVVGLNVDLQIVNVPAVDTADQMGAASSVTFGVRNFGLDAAPSGWDVVLKINNSQVGNFVAGSTLPGLTTMPVTINYTTPQVAPAPADIANVPASLQVNANSAIAESNTANNTVTAALRLVDFVLVTIPTPTSPLQAVNGRAFFANTQQVLPTSYPLPISISYTGLPNGLTPGGNPGVNVIGTPSATAGTFNVTAQGTVDGVTHVASAFTINLFDEITITPGAPPVLTAASGGGPPQNVTITVAGGIYPLTLSVQQPAGITLTGPTTLAAPGLVTYSMSANLAAQTGAQTFPFKAQDGGSVPNTPGNFVQVPVSYSVSQFVDLQVLPFTFVAPPPFLGGQSVGLQLNLRNAGNAASNAANTYSCGVSGPGGTVTVGTGPIASIPGQNGLLTIPIAFNMPPNMAPSANLTCTVSQDPLEAAGALADNTRTSAVTVNSNVDLQVLSITPPTFGQMASAETIVVAVKNNGTDTAPAGWSLGIRINGSPVITPIIIGSTLAGGATLTQSPSVTLPQIGTAPTNSGSYSLDAIANGNAAFPETTTANNVLSSTINLVDFALTAASPGGTAVVGRSISIAPAVNVLPNTYPLPFTLNYTNLPGGVTGSGSPFGQDLTGTPAATGTFAIGTTGTVNAVTRTRTGGISLNVIPEISITLGTAFPGLLSGGSAQPLQVNVTGGVYPVTVALGTLPTGISTLDPVSVILTGPGSVTWNISASVAATTGSFFVTVQGTDNGVTATGTPAGNVSLVVNGSVNGQANYIVSSATYAGHTTGLGADALQVGESAQLDFSVQNIGNLTQGGTVSLSFANTCAGPTGTSVTAPAAGATVSGSIIFSIACSPGSYNQSVSITAAPPESNTGDNTLGPVAFDVFDFQLANLVDIGPQNIPLAGSGNATFTLSESGPPAPLALPLVVTNGGKANTNPTSASVSPGSIPILITAAAGTVSGDTETITGQITRFGVTRTATQAIRFYTAFVNNITSGQPGSTNANPILLPIGGGGSFIDFKLVGDFGGSAAFQLPVVTGFNINLGGSPPSLPNDTFTLQVDAIAGAPTTVTGIPVLFTIPATIPAQTVSTTLYVQAFAVPDIEVTSIVGTGARFAGRDFNIYPWLNGEPGDLSITISNIGAGPSTAGLPLEVRVFGVLVQTASVTVPSIPAGGNTTLTVHVRSLDTMPQLATSFDVQVGADPLEANFANNQGSLAVNTSDFNVGVSGPGDSGFPLNIAVPSPGNSTTDMYVNVMNAGSLFLPIPVFTGAVSSFITPVLPSTLTDSLQSVNVLASTSPQAPSGEYVVQVVAKMMDGATVTAVRSRTIHVTVNSGTPVDTVTLTASPNNALAGAPSTCSGPCTPVQIDGLLVETVTLTATRSGGTSGATDLVFADDGSTIISRVSTSGAPLVQQLAAVPYNTPVQVNFAADEGSTGVLNDGPGYTVVAATAVTTAQRGSPPLDAVGTQHTTLYFNVGDIDINLSCIDLAPGETQPVSIPILDLSGFSKPITWQWLSTGGLNVSITNPTGGSASPPYANINSTFVNNETADIFAVVHFVLAISISNGNGTATKYFNVAVYPFTNGCAFSAGRAAAGKASGVSTQKSYWKRGPVSSSSAVRTVERLSASAALPDLQIKPVDVSMSPSIPQVGDTLDVRFKLVNAGDGPATEVPVALLVNGSIVATETYSLKAGASTLGGFQWKLTSGVVRERAGQMRPARYKRGDDDPDGVRPMGEISAQLVIDPANAFKQKTTAYKSVALTKAGLSTPVGGMPTAAERVYLEMSTICSGFRISSGAVVDCGAGADLDIAIEDFKNARFTLNGALGVADLGVVEPARADAVGAQFNANAALILGHTYAVQMSGGRIGYVKFSASLTPRQLAAEAKLRFGLNGVRILRKLGGDTGSTGAGDVAGRISADALMYFDMTFRP